MNVELVYIFPCDGQPHHLSYAWRFLNSYHENPPGSDHKTTVVCNGGTPDETHELFKTMPNFRLFHHDDSGWDIGAYQVVSQQSKADVMLFCGGTSYFRRPGWMERIVHSVSKYGKDSLYGSMGTPGNMTHNVFPHIRTTGFWVGRELFNKYPIQVRQKEQRYEFEHGSTGLTSWVRNQDLKAWIVGWDTEYVWPNWGNISGGFHNGDQRNLLIGDRLSEPPYHDYS